MPHEDEYVPMGISASEEIQQSWSAHLYEWSTANHTGWNLRKLPPLSNYKIIKLVEFLSIVQWSCSSCQLSNGCLLFHQYPPTNTDPTKLEDMFHLKISRSEGPFWMSIPNVLENLLYPYQINGLSSFTLDFSQRKKSFGGYIVYTSRSNTIKLDMVLWCRMPHQDPLKCQC